MNIPTKCKLIVKENQFMSRYLWHEYLYMQKLECWFFISEQIVHLKLSQTKHCRFNGILTNWHWKEGNNRSTSTIYIKVHFYCCTCYVYSHVKLHVLNNCLDISFDSKPLCPINSIYSSIDKKHPGKSVCVFKPGVFLCPGCGLGCLLYFLYW